MLTVCCYYNILSIQLDTVMYRYCESRRKVLLKHVHEGYDKDLWEYQENLQRFQQVNQQFYKPFSTRCRSHGCYCRHRSKDVSTKPFGIAHIYVCCIITFSLIMSCTANFYDYVLSQLLKISNFHCNDYCIEIIIELIDQLFSQ